MASIYENKAIYYMNNGPLKKRRNLREMSSRYTNVYPTDVVNELRDILENGYAQLTRVLSLFNYERQRLHSTNSTIIGKLKTDDDNFFSGSEKKILPSQFERVATTSDSPMELLKASHLKRQYLDSRKVLTPMNKIIKMEPLADFFSLVHTDRNTAKVTPVFGMKSFNNYSNTYEASTPVSTYNNKQEMVPIGKGKTLIPKHVYDALDWTSYTNVTRKLLQASFTRETLSTHSLSGKPSPAFANKPVKKQLNPVIIEDIISTVSKKCQIDERFVRTCITVKCADEAKMLRLRRSRSGVNDENINIRYK